MRQGGNQVHIAAKIGNLLVTAVGTTGRGGTSGRMALRGELGQADDVWRGGLSIA